MTMYIVMWVGENTCELVGTTIMRNANVFILILLVMLDFVSSDQHRFTGKHLWQEDILNPQKYLEKIYEYYVAGMYLK